MADWGTGTVRAADGAQIHYYRTGGPRPPLVLAHGFSDNGLCWTPVATALAGAYDIVMLDFRGHGLSARLADLEAPDLTLDLAAIIEGLDLDRPIVLGHSMGAANAAQLAAARPELVGSLALEDPPWWDKPPHMPPGQSPLAASLRRLQANPPVDPIPAARALNPGWPDDELEPWVTSKLQFDMRWLDVRPDYAPWQALAPRLRCPGLLLTGDPALGALVPPQVAQAVQAVWPQVEVVHFAGAGHSIRREQRAAYMAALRGWLSALP